jgi:hypothetical protein
MNASGLGSPTFVNYNTGGLGGFVDIAINNGFIYVISSNPTEIRKYHEGNMAFVGNATGLRAGIEGGIYINGGFVYSSINGVARWHESNLALNAHTAGYQYFINGITANNSIVYAVGANGVQTYHQGNLSFINRNTNISGDFGAMEDIKINNGNISVARGGGGSVVRSFESNLAVAQTVSGFFRGLALNNSYVFVGQTNNSTTRVRKLHQSNLGAVANTANFSIRLVSDVFLSNNSVYFTGFSDGTAFTSNIVVQTHEATPTAEVLQFQTITKAKE